MRRFLALFAVLMLTGVLATAQQHPVKGQVTGSDGNPIPGITVQIQGTNTATVTNSNGQFTLTAPSDATLVFTGVGFEEQSVKIDNRSTIDVTLSPSTKRLNEVVITTALGIKRSVRSTGYSVTTVPTSSITQARATNIANGLADKVAGLQVNTVNNGVNPQTRIVLRGERSILGNNQALIVLDNIPVTSDYLSSLNPDDIASTTVLKGANAAALYGSQAANGAILLVSNKGQKGKPRISVTQTTTIEKVSFFPKFQTKFGAASTEGDFVDPLTGYIPHVPYENQQYGAEYNGATLPLGVPAQYTDKNGNVIDTMQSVVYSNKNAIKSFFETGITTENGVSYSDGDDHGTFYLSGQYVNTKGTIPDDKSERSIVRIGATRNYGRFSASASAAYTGFNTNVAGGDYNQSRPVYWNVLNTPGEIDIRKYKDINSLFGQENYFYNAYYPNPYWQIYNSRITTRRQDLLGIAELNFEATDWAKLTYRIGIASTSYQDKATKAGVTFSDYAISDPAGASNTASGFPNGVTPKEGDDLNIYSTVHSDFLATFDKKFFNDFGAKLIIGGSVDQFRSRNASIGGGLSAVTQLEIPGLYNISNVIGIPVVSESKYETGSFGLFGDLQLSYKNFLFVEATGRNDWVSVLAPSNRSFFYPSVSGSFVFTDALPGITMALPWLDFGKVTASWTKVGTVSVGPYGLSNTFGQTSGFPYGGLTGFALGTTLSNPNIKPEFTSSQEYSIHLAMLKSRVNVEATYYNEAVSNQAVNVSLSAATGFLRTTENIPGFINNSGWEFSADISPLLNLGPVKWNVGGNLSLMQSNVDADITPIFIGGYTSGNGVYTIQGKPIREIQVTDWQRDSLGRVIVDPKTGYPTVDPTLKDAGRSTPSILLGLNTSFEYKGLSLKIVAAYRGGYNVYQQLGSSMAFTGTSEITAVAGRGKFVYPNSVIPDGHGGYTPNTSVAIRDGATGAGFWAGTYTDPGSPFVTSGDAWKIREVSLGYDVPLKSTKTVKELHFSLVARNLFTFLPQDNPYADPEYSIFGTANAQGISSENLSPPTRIFGASVNIVF